MPKDQPKEMSPPAGGSELLGSLTTQQQQRTSARVIKKLKLEPLGDKKKRSDGASDGKAYIKQQYRLLEIIYLLVCQHTSAEVEEIVS